jgi:hypothetical protein
MSGARALRQNYLDSLPVPILIEMGISQYPNGNTTINYRYDGFTPLLELLERLGFVLRCQLHGIRRDETITAGLNGHRVTLSTSA